MIDILKRSHPHLSHIFMIASLYFHENFGQLSTKLVTMAQGNASSKRRIIMILNYLPFSSSNYACLYYGQTLLQ